MSRRERKRLETQEKIAEVARGLFAERGFEGVTVAEVAEAADVAEQTVYNHFTRKEDLVYWRRGSFEAQMLEAIRNRVDGDSALAAFHRFVTEPRGMLVTDDPQMRERVAALMETMQASPSLRERERSIMAGYADSLAELLAEETGEKPGDLQAQVAAGAMLAAHQALIDFARRRVVEGARPPRLTREIHAQADRVVALLAEGLGDYATRGKR